ncbi:MAG: plastocyanin/azurin family copper-binding protein [Dehalococcoidia bacterium]
MTMRHGRGAAWVLGAIGAMAMLAACGTPLEEVEPVSGVTTVSVQDNRFDARVIEVPAGAEVTWRFDGEREHNVVGEGWQSEVMSDGSYAHTFETPGTYDYLCTLHRGMDGRVIVTQ